jgi:hypothetical protein
VRLEGLGQLKKSNDLIGNRTRDFPACRIVPQPTTPAGIICTYYKFMKLPITAAARS